MDSGSILHDLALYGNELLMSSSKQAGFLAAALIAAAPFWSTEYANDIFMIIAFVCLVVSILLSIIIHFVTGLIYTKQVSELKKELSPKAFYMKSSFILGGLQALTLFTGIALVSYNFFFKYL